MKDVKKHIPVYSKAWETMFEFHSTKRIWVLAGLLALVIILTLVLTACGDDDDDDADGDTASREVGEPNQSGCLYHKAVEGAVEEMVRFRFANNMLSVEHSNACRQCGWDFDGNYSIENGTLEIVEGDSSDADIIPVCSCFFNNSYEIPDVVAGPYHLTVLTRDLYGEVDVQIEEDVDFSQQTDYDFSLGEHACG